MPSPLDRTAAPPRRYSVAFDYVLAVGLSLAAGAVRIGFDGILHSRSPLLLNIIVVMIAAHLVGAGPAVAGIVASLPTAVVLFADSRYDFPLDSAPVVMMFALNFAIMASAVALVRAANRNRAKAVAEAAARATAEQAARDASSDFDALGAAASAIVFVRGPGGAMESFNNRWYEYTGLAPQQCLNGAAGWRDALHPDDAAVIRAAWESPHLSAAPLEHEIRYRRRDGAFRWHLARVIRPDPAVDRWVGVAVDIHDRKCAENALRRSEEHLRLAHQAGRLGSWEFDPTTGRLFLPPPTLALLGFTTDAVPDTLDGFLAGVHERDRARVRHLFTAPAPPAANDSDGSDFEITFRMTQAPASAGHRWFTLRGRVPAHTPPGGTTTPPLAGILIDVTTAKALEEQLDRSRELFERIAETTPDILYLYDVQESRAVYVNSGVTRVLGYPQAQLKAMHPGQWSRLVHPDDGDRLRAEYDRFAGLPDGGTLEHEYRMRAADGRWCWLRTRDVVFARDSGGSPKLILGVARDVTAERAAADALRATTAAAETDRAQLRAIITQMTEGVIIIAPDRGVIEFNAAAQTIHGNMDRATADRFFHAPQPPVELTDLYGRPVPRREYPSARALRGETLTDCELVVHRTDTNHTFVGSFNATPVRDAHGTVVLVVLTVRDVTAQRRAADAVRTSESRYRCLVDATANVVFTTDPQGAFVDSQPSWQAYTGQTADDYADFGWTAAVHPDDRPALLAAWYRAKGAHAIFSAEARLWHAPTAVHRHTAFRGVPVRDDRGAVHEWVGAATDVHEQRTAERALALSEERLRIAIDAAQLGTFYCEFPLGRIVWNDACKDHFFVPHGADVDFDLFYARLHPDDREPTRRAIDRAAADRAPYDVEYRTVSPDGTQTHWIRAIGKVYFDPAGRPARLDGVTLDITDRKRAQLDLEAARRAAEDASRAKDRFLAVLSHELRTPLTPVLTGVQLFEDDPATPPHLLDVARMIRRNVDLEARLIDDLLDLTRIARGRLSLHTETVDAHQKLGSVLNICASDFKAKRLTLQTDLAATRHHISADGARIQQVLWNLLKNAAKFTPESGRVTVRTYNAPAALAPATSPTSEPPPSHLVIEISDTGAGIDPSYLPSIFTAFDQGNTETSRRLGGLGLGLTISKTLVDLHGGTLRATSAGVSKGATFTVTLPTVPAPAAAGSPNSAPATPTPAGQRRLSILVVEDHPDTARAVSLLLRTRGHRVVLADSVATGLATATLEPFDLLISDIGLPDGSGHDLMRQLLAQRRDIKAICLSGFGMEEDIRKSREAGFLEHLTKPVTFPHLESAIQRITAQCMP